MNLTPWMLVCLYACSGGIPRRVLGRLHYHGNAITHYKSNGLQATPGIEMCFAGGPNQNTSLFIYYFVSNFPNPDSVQTS